MKRAHKIEDDLKHIANSITEINSKESSAFKVRNIKKQLKKSYDDIAKLKDPERQQSMAKLAELRSSLKALLEKWELSNLIPNKGPNLIINQRKRPRL